MIMICQVQMATEYASIPRLNKCEESCIQSERALDKKLLERYCGIKSQDNALPYSQYTCVQL